MTGDPQGPIDARIAARHLMQRPLTCAEHDPEVFRLIRRHAATLDRWFTQRFGDRVHVDADTARLYKSVAPPADRPLRTSTDRPLRPRQYVLVALCLGAVSSGPDVISLRDLVAAVRSAAAEAQVPLLLDAPDRKALVTALQWMIGQGLIFELHDRVERYSADEDADAVLRIRADRIALATQLALADASSAEDLLAGAAQRGTTRQRMRAQLANNPVVYRDDLSPEDWSELRRRLGEEAATLDEMLGLEIEARAEGVAAIDPTGSLSDRRFPSGGTESHAALLLIDRLVQLHATQRAEVDGDWVSRADVIELIAELATARRRHWKAEYRDRPDRLADAVVDLLADLRLVERDDPSSGDWRLRPLPAAARFTVAVDDSADSAGAADAADGQERLW